MHCFNFILFYIYIFCIFWFKKVAGIVGGSDVISGQFNYHVSLFLHNRPACGGAILNSQYVLTAAQCIMGEDGKFFDEKLLIMSGAISVNDPNRIIIEVVRAYVPYDFRQQQNNPFHYSSEHLQIADIAVLKLKSALPIGQNRAVQSLMLPKKTKRGYSKYTFKKARFTGFGSDVPCDYKSASDLSNILDRQHSSKKLMYAEAFVEKNGFCRVAYKSFNEAHLCAELKPFSTNKLIGTCHGDIGGPLVFNEDTVIGVLSKYQNDCSEKLNPALYTRVTSFLPFINSALQDQIDSHMRIADYTNPRVLEIITTDKMSDLI